MKKTLFLLCLCSLALLPLGCGKKKAGGFLGYSENSKFPSSLQPGLILRYNKPGLQNRLIGYIYDVNKDKGYYMVQYMVLDYDGERYFYGNRKVPLDNLKYGHRIDHAFYFNGGVNEVTNTSTTFLGSDEIIKQLDSEGQTTFSYEANNANSLHKRGKEKWEFNYNGKMIELPMLLAQTGPLGVRRYSPFLLGLYNKPGFPLLLRSEDTALAAVEDFGYVASLLAKHFESTGSLLTGSLYCAIFNLSDGSPTHLMWMQLSQDLWKRALLPVVQSQPSKKWVMELFSTQNGKPAVVSKSKPGTMKMAVKMLQEHIQQDCPNGQCTVRLGSSVDNLPAEFSPIGSDPEVRLFIHPES